MKLFTSDEAKFVCEALMPYDEWIPEHALTEALVTVEIARAFSYELSAVCSEEGFKHDGQRMLDDVRAKRARFRLTNDDVELVYSTGRVVNLSKLRWKRSASMI